MLLLRWRQGDDAALQELMPLVYAELHRIAQAVFGRQRPNHTLQPTALVNEACVRLIESSEIEFADRAHFLAVMSRMMRQVLVDHARAVAAGKRGGHEKRVPWDTNVTVKVAGRSHPLQVIELDRALDALARESSSLGQIVEMHYFGGLTADEAAVVLGRSADAVRHDLRLGRAWLRRELAD